MRMFNAFVTVDGIHEVNKVDLLFEFSRLPHLKFVFTE